MLGAARSWIFGTGLVLLVSIASGQAPRFERALPLGVQSCDTECQSRETDCDLACDQVVACVEECKKASEVCVQKCREPAPKAKPAPTAPPSAVPAPDKKTPPPKASGSAKPATPSKPDQAKP